MKIKIIVSQHRRDFTAALECEHCGATQTLSGGYDYAFYHTTVIPSINCQSCGKVAPESYRGLTTKYAEGEVI
jgi:transcription elongation factor Elf1